MDDISLFAGIEELGTVLWVGPVWSPDEVAKQVAEYDLQSNILLAGIWLVPLVLAAVWVYQLRNRTPPQTSLESFQRGERLLGLGAITFIGMTLFTLSLVGHFNRSEPPSIPRLVLGTDLLAVERDDAFAVLRLDQVGSLRVVRDELRISADSHLRAVPHVRVHDPDGNLLEAFRGLRPDLVRLVDAERGLVAAARAD